MTRYFEESLAKLRKRLVKMLILVDDQLDHSFKVLLNSDDETLKTIKHNENKVDKLDIKIDKLCQAIFALEQPVAHDLRFIMGSLKASNEIERIGDIAYDIAKRAETVSKFSESLNEYKLPYFMDQLRKLFAQTTEAFINLNKTLAAEIIEDCKNGKKQYKQIFNDIVAGMNEKSDLIAIATDLILITHDFERIMGHIENIAEAIIFIVEAKIIKHKELKSSIDIITEKKRKKEKKRKAAILETNEKAETTEINSAVPEIQSSEVTGKKES